MIENNKVDLRRLRKKDVLMVDAEVSNAVISELESYGVSIDYLDASTTEVTIRGQKEIKIGSTYVLRDQTEKWQVGEYLKKARIYERNRQRIERIRQKEGLDAYEQDPLSSIVHTKSDRLSNRKGLNNAIATQKKILKRDKDTKISKIEEAVKNLRNLRELKTKAFDNPDDFFTADELKHFKNKKGKFRSKAKEREYYQSFSEMVVERYEEYEGQFYGWLSEQLDTSQTSFKEQYNMMTDMEKESYMVEYTKTRINRVIEATGSLEQEEMDLSEEEAYEIYKRIRKEDGRL